MRPSALIQNERAPWMTPAFVKQRNEWYRRLEAEGMEIEEAEFVPRRQRKRKGPAHGDVGHYKGFMPEVGKLDGETDTDTADRANAARFGGPRAVWNMENADFWRLMSEYVEALPWGYYGKTLLRRWAEIGDLKTAAAETGIGRWKARRVLDEFMNLLKRKKVLR